MAFRGFKDRLSDFYGDPAYGVGGDNIFSGSSEDLYRQAINQNDGSGIVTSSGSLLPKVTGASGGTGAAITPELQGESPMYDIYNRKSPEEMEAEALQKFQESGKQFRDTTGMSGRDAKQAYYEDIFGTDPATGGDPLSIGTAMLAWEASDDPAAVAYRERDTGSDDWADIVGSGISNVVNIGSLGAINPETGEGWAQGGNVGESLKDVGTDIVQTGTLGAITPGEEEGWAEPAIEAGVDLLGDVAGGLTEGDASSQQFEAMWPYKQEQLEGARTAFQDPSSMYPGFSPDTQAYIDQVRDRVASGNITLDQAQLALQGVLAGDKDPSKAYFEKLKAGNLELPEIMQGYREMLSPTDSAMGMLQRGMTDPSLSPAMSQLGRTAAGEYMGGNPYLDAMYQRAAGQATRAYEGATGDVGSMFSKAGRYGSAAHQKAMSEAQRNLGESLAGLSTDLYGGAYESERGRQLGAAGTMGGLQLGALGGMSGLQGQQLGRRTAGAGALSDIYGRGQQTTLQAMQPAFQFGQQDYADLGQLGAVGGMQDVLAGQQAKEPWEQVSQYGAAIGGIPQQQQQQGGSPWGSLIGAGLGAFGGSFGGPGGTLAGAKFGAGLGGLFG
jgi:hypothetical protein